MRDWLARLNRILKRFDGAQKRRDIRELRAIEAEIANDPYERAARAEVDALLGHAHDPDAMTPDSPTMNPFLGLLSGDPRHSRPS